MTAHVRLNPEARKQERARLFNEWQSAAADHDALCRVLARTAYIGRALSEAEKDAYRESDDRRLAAFDAYNTVAMSPSALKLAGR